MKQLLYTMFTNNNHDSFHLWWKENLVKLQEVLKHYDQDRSKDTACVTKRFLCLHVELWKTHSSANYSFEAAFLGKNTILIKFRDCWMVFAWYCTFSRKSNTCLFSSLNYLSRWLWTFYVISVVSHDFVLSK